MKRSHLPENPAGQNSVFGVRIQEFHRKMKNVALIFAGGSGKRMNSGAIPKQFLELYGKPIIIYTLEKFENHDDIQGIVVVCIHGWISEMRKYVRRFGITKVKAIVPGGETGQESIHNGLLAVKKLYPDDTVVLIHDGVRPLVDPETITKCIECTKEKGNAMTVVPATETIFVGDGKPGVVGDILDRSRCEMVRAPQCFRLGDILECHEKALEEGKKDFIDSASMFHYYGHTLYSVIGSTENIKITTPIDYYIFRAIVDAKENSRIFGYQ